MVPLFPCPLRQVVYLSDLRCVVRASVERSEHDSGVGCVMFAMFDGLCHGRNLFVNAMFSQRNCRQVSTRFQYNFSLRGLYSIEYRLIFCPRYRNMQAAIASALLKNKERRNPCIEYLTVFTNNTFNFAHTSTLIQTLLYTLGVISCVLRLPMTFLSMATSWQYSPDFYQQYNFCQSIGLPNFVSHLIRSVYCIPDALSILDTCVFWTAAS